MTPGHATLQRWRENPVAFAYEAFKFTPDKWQEEALRKFPSQDPAEKIISLQACTGPGKTAVQAICLLNFVGCYGHLGKHPKGFCVSITQDNLRGNLWPELSRWQQRSEYFKGAFTWGAERFYANDHPETWFIEARTWSQKANKEAQGRTLSGLHAPYVMVDIDEAGDIPVPIFQSGQQIFSSQHEWAKILIGGNPTNLEGCLYHAATHARPLTYVIRVTGDPDDPNRSPRVDMANAKEQIRLYGRDNPWIMSTILGQFPPASINALVSLEDVLAAQARVLEPHQYEWSQKRIGVDVARFGNDRSVMCPRQGLKWEKPPAPMRGARTTEIAARVAVGINKWGTPDTVQVFVDDTGHWGHGVIDNLFSAGYSPFPVIYHGPSSDPRYKNKTTEMHFAMAEAIKSGAQLPNIPDLVQELVSRTYTFIGGKLALEDKAIAKARLGRSPDWSDGYANTYAWPDMPAEIGVGPHRSNVAKSDWDPNTEMNER